MTQDAALVERISEVVHEANRAQQKHTGEQLNPHWDTLSEDLRDSTRQGVIGVMQGNTPEQSHESWMRERERTGWVYGPVKDIARKVHPCLVPYRQLPVEQRVKDHVFAAIVREMVAVLGKPTLAESFRAGASDAPTTLDSSGYR